MPRYDTTEDLRLSWWDRYRMHWSFASVAVMCVSFVASCDEIRYATSGQTASGVVTRVLQRPKSKLKIEYQFAEQDGTPRSGSFVLAERDSLLFPEGTPFTVQYLPGNEQESRPHGPVRWFVFVPALGAVVALGFAGVKFWIEFRDHERRSRAAEMDDGWAPMPRPQRRK